ncbi:MAG: phage terminase large subunit family protein [Clostridiales bacterium]|nr:phage terminase large subunit family protein [Clostridiales bacterium]
MDDQREEKQELSPEAKELFQKVFKKLEPPPDITLSQWADKYRYLSSESASEPGRWRTDRAPYQREPMNAITDPHNRKIILMWASQLGKTDSAILNTVGYFMHYDPAPIMILQPTVEMAETVSKNRLSPMLRDTPVLAELARNKSRDKANTIQEKQFPGGYITLQGANSPAALASRPIRILCADEIDRYPPSAGNEGDPLFLAQKRMTAFWNAKEIVTSTPTIKGQSRVETEYEHSTMEVWNVPCPACGQYQPLTWAKIKFDKDGFREGRTQDVFMECEHCSVVSTEAEWKSMCQQGKYIPTHPKRRVRGFYVNALASLFTTWREIVDDFITAVDESRRGNMNPLKSWTNTVMAETWDEAGTQVSDNELMQRLEDYGADVPDMVLYLTAGVDVQDDRFEYEVVGWGLGKESWGIEKGAIYGDLKQKDVWERLDQVLLKTWKKKNGTTMALTASCVDTGGHFTNEVYRFCLNRWNRNVWAIKGSNKGMDVPYISNPTKNNRVKVPLFLLGVDTGKCLIYDRLNVEHPGPGYCHFPAGDHGYDELYFKGLTAEKHIVTYKKGRATWAWVLKDQGFRRNEPLDIRNYAQAAMEIAHLPLEPTVAMLPAKRGRRQLNRGIEED